MSSQPGKASWLQVLRSRGRRSPDRQAGPARSAGGRIPPVPHPSLGNEDADPLTWLRHRLRSGSAGSTDLHVCDWSLADWLLPQALFAGVLVAGHRRPPQSLSERSRTGWRPSVAVLGVNSTFVFKSFTFICQNYVSSLVVSHAHFTNNVMKICFFI